MPNMACIMQARDRKYWHRESAQVFSRKKISVIGSGWVASLGNLRASQVSTWENAFRSKGFFACQGEGRSAQSLVAMNKAELIESIQNALGKDATKRSADEALDAVLNSIAKGVKKDKKVQIIGFGTFEVKKRAARMGRNPKTGESMKIAASKSVGFKPSSVLKGLL
jgi:DNA-binding protein HU-beta